MTFQFHRALFGLTSQGHRLLKSSLDPHDFPGELEAYSDRLRGTSFVPSWQPYFSSRSFGKWHAFCYTLPDPTQSREGAVKTRTLVLPKRHLQNLPALRPIFTALQNEDLFSATGSASPLDIEFPPVPRSLMVDPRMPDLLQKLMAGQAVISITSTTLELLDALWSRAWPDLRTQLGFQTAFMRDDVQATEASIVLVPENATSRWDASTLLKQGEPSTPTEKYFCGLQVDHLHDVIPAVSGSSIQLLRPLNALATALESWQMKPDLRNAKTILESIQLLSLEERKFNGISGELYKQLPSCFLKAAAADVMFTANASFDKTPFPALVEDWVQRHLFDDVDETALLFKRAFHAQDWWKNAVLGGAAKAVRGPRASDAERVWSLLMHEETYLHLWPLLDKTWDPIVASSVPEKMPARHSGKLSQLFKDAGWWNTYTSMVTMHSPEGIQEVLATVPEDVLPAALQRVQGHKGSHFMVHQAVKRHHPLLMSLAVENIHQDAQLMQELDLAQEGWLSLWRELTKAQTNPWFGIRNVSRTWHDLLQLLNKTASSTGNDVVIELVDILSTTSQAHLLHISHRNDVLNALPARIRAKLIKNTAQEWLKLDHHAEPLEEAFTNAIFESALNLQPKAPMVQNLLHGYKDQLTNELITRLSRAVVMVDLSEAIGHQLGELVSGKHLRTVAQSVSEATRASRKPGGIAFVKATSSLLGWLERLKLGIALPDLFSDQMDEDTWWATLQELCIHIAWKGPVELWVAAEGAEAHVPEGETAAIRWQKSIAAIRVGQGPKKKLFFKAIRNNYPENSEVAYLFDKKPF